ncbi:MAG: helix-turn-helix domain-containing protein, partial [Brachybacterium sp.]|nr:helix-turn-helix domain-containing protein [Brachybacterium sp.]
MPQTQGSRCAMPEGREGEDPAQAMLAEPEEPPDPRGPEAVRSRVRWSITESGLAQREFARRLGLDETKLSKALRGTRRFSPTELAQIADIADVTVTWLLSGI